MCVEKGSVSSSTRTTPACTSTLRKLLAPGSMTGDSTPELCDGVLTTSRPCLTNPDPQCRIPMPLTVTWTQSSMCCGNLQPPFDSAKPSLPALASLFLFNGNEKEGGRRRRSLLMTTA